MCSHRAVDEIWEELRRALPSVAFLCSLRFELAKEDQDDEADGRVDILGAGPGIWDAVSHALRDFPLAQAGKLRGRLCACSPSLAPSLASRPSSASSSSGALAVVAERQRPLWLQRSRRSWSSRSGNAVPAGFGAFGATLLEGESMSSVGHTAAGGAAVGTLGGEVFSCGGWMNSDATSAATEVYVPELDDWEKVPPHPVSVACRVWSVQGLLAKQLYVVDPDAIRRETPRPIEMQTESSSESEPDTNSTLTPFALPKLPLQRARREPCADFHRFDALRGIWAELPHLFEARAEAAAAALGGKLYVCGGIGDDGQTLTSAECWDPCERTWRRLPPLTCGRAFASAQALGKKFLVCGGVGDDGKPLCSAELFDPRRGTWQTLPPAPPPRGLAA